MTLLALGLAGFAAASSPPVGLRIHIEADGPHLTWTSVARHRYDVESAESPVGPWIGRARVFAETGSVAWVDTNAVRDAGSRFYRVADRGLPDAVALNEAQAFLAVEALPLELGDSFVRSARDAADAVQAATRLTASSQAVTTGTLTLTGDASNPVRYDPTPRDRLVLVPVTGARTEIWVVSLDLVRNVFEWRQVTGDVDLTFRSAPGLQANILTAHGIYVSTPYAGIRFAVDLRAEVSGFDEVDSSGSHSLSDVTLTGTVAANGFSLEVQARNRFEFVSARNSVGRLESASTSEIWGRHRLVLAGDVFLWVDAKRQRSFRDGRESDIDSYWSATGTLTRNGAPYGTLRKTLRPVGNSVVDLRFQWMLPGSVVDIEQWTIQVPGVSP